MFNFRALFRLGMQFIRRNDTKILAVAAAGIGVATTVIAVKSGMQAKEALDAAQEQLPEGEELSTKEEVTIIAKAAAPAVVSTAVEIGAIYALFRRGRIKEATALSLASFYQQKVLSRPLLIGGTESEAGYGSRDSPDRIIPENADFANIPFDLFEPLSGRVIKNVTSGRLALTEYWLNKNVEFGYIMSLSDVIQMLGGNRLAPWIADKYTWTNTMDIVEYNARMYWIDFLVKPNDRGIMELSFSRIPTRHDSLIDSTVS